MFSYYMTKPRYGEKPSKELNIKNLTSTIKHGKRRKIV